MKIKIALALVLIFALLQLFPGEQINKPIEPENDFLTQIEGHKDAVLLIKSTCYDCHSNQPKYPWYSRLTPLSWWINDHIEHGRSHLNFSEWSTYSAKKKAHKLEECSEELEEGEMPLYSYTIMHSEAQFEPEEVKLLVEFFKEQEAKYKNL